MNDGGSKNEASGRMGKAVEHLVAATCILSSRGVLNVSTSLVDDEGVDLVFHRRAGTATLAVQVKARMSDSRGFGRGVFLQDLRKQTFNPRPDLYALFVPADVQKATFDFAWLVPSEEIVRTLKPNPQGKYRFVASLKQDAKDRWQPFRLPRARLPERILEILAELDSKPSNSLRPA